MSAKPTKHRTPDVIDPEEWRNLSAEAREQRAWPDGPVRAEDAPVMAPTEAERAALDEARASQECGERTYSHEEIEAIRAAKRRRHGG